MADVPLVRIAMLGLGWQRDQPSGLNRYVDDLIAAMRARGHDVGAVVEGPATGAPAWVDVAGEATQPLPVRLLAYRRAAARAARGAAVVDAHFALYALPSIIAGPIRRIPLVVHFHGPWADESEASGTAGRAVLRSKRAVERAVYRRAQRVVVLSDAFGRVVTSGYGVAANRVEVIPPAVDLVRFRPGDRDAARAGLGVPASTFVAVAARRLVKRMGLDVLVDAWARVDRPDRLLTIVGEGPERDALERRAEAAGVADRVRFCGRVDDSDLVAWHHAADVAVVPSIALEGFGLVVLESLACGTPVVVSAVGGLPEAVAGLEHDTVVPAGDVGALASRLVGAADGTWPLPSRERCRAFAERFSPERFAVAHERLFEAVLAGHHGAQQRPD